MIGRQLILSGGMGDYGSDIWQLVIKEIDMVLLSVVGLGYVISML
jgi:hypothetical protein